MEGPLLILEVPIRIRRMRTIAYEQDEVRWLIKHLRNKLKVHFEDIAISKRYNDLEMAKGILGKPEGSQEPHRGPFSGEQK